MRKLILVSLLTILTILNGSAQGGNDTLQRAGIETPTLTTQVIDSLIRDRMQEDRSQLAALMKEEAQNDRQLFMAGLIMLGVLLLVLLYSTRRTRSNRDLARGGKSASVKITESDGIQMEIRRLTEENEKLKKEIGSYNGVRQDYETLKHGIMTTYKVKHYPGYEKEMEEYLAFQGVFDTESSVANYAYQKFLKPILAIADKNKNNPARVSDEERQKVLDLLVSLSLLYIEYLYLRVGDLSVGGKMVERIKGFAKGNGFDPSLLKKLNTASGNRALVLRMILDRSDLHNLSYPVFDETNLNN